MIPPLNVRGTSRAIRATPNRDPYPFLSPPQAPGELGVLGGYRILKLLGSGGMGFVFEAHEIALRRRVALKVLKPELALDAENRERFLREARAAAAIESDHVVAVFHIKDAEPPYLAMQFLEGETLQARIEQSPPITLRNALEIARQTAAGLAAAHALGLIHRDIKPANLWLERRNDTHPPDAGCHPPPFRVKLLDFGLARRINGETSLTSTGFIVGTPNFMAPEQANGIEVDGRADLFSLGCVLFTVLAGELPFQGNSALAVMMSLTHKTPPPVNEMNPDVPQSVADLVAALLEKDREKRPQSALEVVASIDSILAGITGNALLPLSSANMTVHRAAEMSSGPESDFTPPFPMPQRKPAPTPTPTPQAPEGRRTALATWLVIGSTILVAVGVGIYRLLFAGE